MKASLFFVLVLSRLRGRTDIVLDRSFREQKDSVSQPIHTEDKNRNSVGSRPDPGIERKYGLNRPFYSNQDLLIYKLKER